jgi:hypothetical protein
VTAGAAGWDSRRSSKDGSGTREDEFEVEVVEWRGGGIGGNVENSEKKEGKAGKFHARRYVYFSLPCAVVLARSKCNEAAAIKFDGRHGMRAES